VQCNPSFGGQFHYSTNILLPLLVSSCLVPVEMMPVVMHVATEMMLAMLVMMMLAVMMVLELLLSALIGSFPTASWRRSRLVMA
jgi:hypothetical protein